jgi:hypothetical protein
MMAHCRPLSVSTKVASSIDAALIFERYFPVCLWNRLGVSHFHDEYARHLLRIIPDVGLPARHVRHIAERHLDSA